MIIINCKLYWKQRMFHVEQESQKAPGQIFKFILNFYNDAFFSSICSTWNIYNIQNKLRILALIKGLNKNKLFCSESENHCSTWNIFKITTRDPWLKDILFMFHVKQYQRRTQWYPLSHRLLYHSTWNKYLVITVIQAINNKSVSRGTTITFQRIYSTKKFHVEHNRSSP